MDRKDGVLGSGKDLFAVLKFLATSETEGDEHLVSVPWEPGVAPVAARFGTHLKPDVVQNHPFKRQTREEPG
eukprot:9467877-Pyramimonas_sp.AAC.1